MNCDHCDEQFIDSKDGLIQLTFHTIVRHGDQIR